MNESTMHQLSASKAVLGVWELRWILLMGCLIVMLSMGVRLSFGLFTEPVTREMGWPYSVFGQALSVQNLMWGVLGTFAAIIADRRGSMPVIMVGAILYAAGTIGMSFATSVWLVHAFMGFVAGAGIAATGFTLVAISFSKLMPPDQRTWAMGLGTAAASFGQFAVGMPIGLLIPEDGSGWRQIMFAIGCITLLIFVMAFAFRKAGDPRYILHSARSEMNEDLGMWRAIQQAFGHSGYQLLFFGFFVCGFHIAIIYIYLPSYLKLFPNVPGYMPELALGLVGIFNIIGAYLAGLIGSRYPNSKRLPLAWIYLLRSFVILGFVLLPATALSTGVFASLMGLLWLSTVPLTSGIIASQWGPRYLSTLYGFVFFSHQVGSFVGSTWAAWLLDNFNDGVFVGPRVLVPIFQGFDNGFSPMWWSAIVLGVIAFLIHMPIDEKPVVPATAAISGN